MLTILNTEISNLYKAFKALFINDIIKQEAPQMEYPESGK